MNKTRFFMVFGIVLLSLTIVGMAFANDSQPQGGNPPVDADDAPYSPPVQSDISTGTVASPDYVPMIRSQGDMYVPPESLAGSSGLLDPEIVLWDNGPLVTHPGGGAGGNDASVVQTALGMATYGLGNQVSSGNRVADEFSVAGPNSWQIDQIAFFAYQSYSSITCTIDHINLRIWDGPPDDPGSTIVFGDTTTNRLVDCDFATMYRVLDTALTNPDRPIMEVFAAVGVTLPPGTYWLDWQTSGTLASGPWAPPVTILGQTTTGNALHYTTSSGTWNPAVDTGTLTPQGFPFVITGSVVTTPGIVLSPGSIRKEGCEESDVTYTLYLENNTGSSGTFNLTYSSIWQVSGPAQLSVANGNTVNFDVTVYIPCGGVGDITTVSASGNGYTSNPALLHTYFNPIQDWNAENADLGALPVDAWGMGYANLGDQMWIVAGVQSGLPSPVTHYFNPGTATWLTGGDLDTSPVYRTSAITGEDGKLYKISGSINSFNYTGESDRYAPPWTAIASEPNNGRMDNVLGAYGGFIWSITGLGSDANVRRYNPATNSWLDVGTPPPFGVNYARSGCQIGNKVYIFGDATTPGFEGLWSYNMETTSWAHLSPNGSLPLYTGIWAPAWVADPDTGLCYLTGGATIPASGDLKTVYVYNTITNTWLEPLPEMTTARDFHAAFLYTRPADGHKLLCVAGGNSSNVGLASTQCLDLTGCTTCQPPEISVSPDFLYVRQPPNKTTTREINICASGESPVNWVLSEVPGVKLAGVPLPVSDENIPPVFEGHSIGRAPWVNPGDPAPGQTFSLAGEPAFGVDIYPGSSLVHFPNTTDPGFRNVISRQPYNQYFAGDFINSDYSTLYVIDAFMNQLRAINSATGGITAVGPTIPLAGHIWTGMTGSFDGIMYASSSNITISTLYTVDLATGEATAVGEITNAPAIIDIAIAPNGQMYGVDVVNDNLVRINTVTGAGTIIGGIGFNANYAQGMDFEDRTSILYLATFNNDTHRGELRSANLSTGNTTLIGPFPGGGEIDAFAFATGSGTALPWLYEDPIHSIFQLDMCQPVLATFNSTGLALGAHLGQITINSNDPDDPVIVIPVTLDVGDYRSFLPLTSNP